MGWEAQGRDAIAGLLGGGGQRLYTGSHAEIPVCCRGAGDRGRRQIRLYADSHGTAGHREEYVLRYPGEGLVLRFTDDFLWQGSGRTDPGHMDK